MGGDAGVDQQTNKMRNLLMYVLPALTPIFISFAPAAVQLSFTAAAFTSLCSTTLLRNPAFRKWLKLTPRLPPASAAKAPATPYKGTMTVAGRARPYGTSAPTQPAPKSTLSQFTPSGIRATFQEAKKTVTDSVQNAMPAARKQASNPKERQRAREAAKYEETRSKIIDQMRVEYEKEQEAMARTRRR